MDSLLTWKRRHTLYTFSRRWGLTNSLGSWIMLSNNNNPVRKASVLNSTDGLKPGPHVYHVGNHLLQQWAQIPLPPHLSRYDLVRLQENTLFSDT
ncbi:hypothetical protein YC2023_036352 [Brassica napus]